MSIIYDELETDIIMKKLSGNNEIIPQNNFSGNIVNIKMLDSLDRMNKTSVNRSYRPIQADGFKHKITCLVKRFVRRMTFWFVEPCMIQQTDYNSANNIFSAEVNAEINSINSRLETIQVLDDKIAEMSQKISAMNLYIEKTDKYISQNDRYISEMEKSINNMRNSLENINMTFSQSGEDSIIKYIFNTLGRKIGTYLDLGANHAFYLSNTYNFYAQGARGVLVEANPELARELIEKRPEDIVINKCLAEKSGEKLDFYIMNGDGLSTTDYQSALNFIKENPALAITKKITIDSVTINEIIQEYFPETAPDIMNIDIEGMELSILKMTNFETFRPLVIICEMIEYRNGLPAGQKNYEIIELMRKNDYREFAFTGINSIFIDIRQEDIKL
ncbi:MAG: FkbM family methyltransferase [Ruminococcus sp.]|nr:FkbM family methyltransferase [Ruminococcus sp.]